MKLQKSVLGTSLGLLLAACGGGGGGGGGGLAAPSNLSYGDDNSIYMVGVDVAPNLASVAGTVSAFSVSPALPTGLSLDPLTGRIDGTPAANVARAEYTITASNAAGSTDFDLEIEVVWPPRFLFTASLNDSTLASFTVDPRTGMLEHNTYSASPISEYGPEAICVHPSGRFIYVPNLASDNVSVYAVDENDGWLSIGSAALAGVGPHTMEIHPSGDFAYVASQGTNEISVYAIDDATGALTQLGAPMATASQPGPMSVHPGGRFLVLGNLDFPRRVTIYDIDAGTGGLSASQPSIVLNGGVPVSLDFSPDGRFVFTALTNYDAVVSIAVRQADGVMRIASATGTQPLPGAVQVHPNGDFFVVANEGDDSISVLAIERDTGVLTSLGAKPVGMSPDAALFDPTGRFLYLLNQTSADVLVFEIDRQNGDLAAVGQLRTRRMPTAMAFVAGTAPVTKSSRFAYVANSESDDVSTFAMDSLTGNLTEIGLAALAGDNPVAVAVDPNVRFAYVANHDDGTIGMYSIDPTSGVLFEIAPAVAVGDAPTALAVDRSGRFLYSVQHDDDTLAVFVIDQADGSLLQIASLAVPDGLLRPEDVGTDPTGQFLYVAASGDGTLGTSGVSVFATDPRTGLASRSTDPSILHGASHVAFHPAGGALFAILADTHEIASFGIDALDGGLDEILPRVTSAELPSALAVDLAGRHLFAAFADPLGSGQVSSFAIEADLSLGAGHGPYIGGTRPSDLAFDPSGSFLNVINRDSNEITTFAYDAQTGLLATPTSTLTGLGPIAIAVTTALH